MELMQRVHEGDAEALVLFLELLVERVAHNVHASLAEGWSTAALDVLALGVSLPMSELAAVQTFSCLLAGVEGA